ncbi:MAG: S-methyl-5'-thioinosine phosphorylase [Pseudohongiellaceae bacterium]
MLAIIGGTGLSRLSVFTPAESRAVQTTWAAQPVTLEIMKHHGKDLVFLPRHGASHAVPPHRVNYRANIAALQEVGVTSIIAVNAVGGIHPDMGPGALMLPDQIIDYTHGRAATFFEDDLDAVTHIDFSDPFSALERQQLSQVLEDCNDHRVVLGSGVYGVTQGPRLETAAEITRLQRDGCDVVGMTAMPEAALAREAGLGYGMLALSVNWAAGLTPEPITMDQIRGVLADGMALIATVLDTYASRY